LRKLLLILLPLAVLVGGAWWLMERRSGLPQVPFARARHQSLSSTLVTNGRAEPSRWSSIRAERPGLVSQLMVAEGESVQHGAGIAVLSAPEARAELVAAEARLTEAQAELANLRGGGRPQELTEIENSLSRARLDLGTAEREVEGLRRLVEKQAATRYELEQAEARVAQARAQIEALEKRRQALVGDRDVEAARARVRNAEAGLQLARSRLADVTVRAPMSGVVYSLPVRAGSYVNPGDEVGRVGVVEMLRVTVFVDEPELGRVALGQPVRITWDARPGRVWEGTVGQLPTQVVTHGTREVGEVICTIGNAERDLLPGTNVNVEILTASAERALTIPKAALRTVNRETGVYLLQEGNRIAWRSVKAGIASITDVEVLDGLSEGDAVALQSETGVEPGMEVRPQFP
jgi:HlyD family secretion protein